MTAPEPVRLTDAEHNEIIDAAYGATMKGQLIGPALAPVVERIIAARIAAARADERRKVEDEFKDLSEQADLWYERARGVVESEKRAVAMARADERRKVAQEIAADIDKARSALTTLGCLEQADAVRATAHIARAHAEEGPS